MGVIGSTGLRPLRRYQTVRQTFRLYYPPSPCVQYRPRASSRSYDQTYVPCYATQFVARLATSYPKPRAQQTSAPFTLRTQRQFSQLGMSLSQALQKLTKAGLLTALTPRPPPQHVPPQFMMDLHYAYHQGPGHKIDRCTALRHAIQDLID